MDEPAIRMWAWNEMRSWGHTITDDEGKSTFKPYSEAQRILAADQLAAWVMSGQVISESAE